MLLGKTKLDTIKVLMSKIIIHHILVMTFFSVNNVLQWDEKRNKNSRNFCGTHYINMDDITRKSIKVMA